MDFYKTLGELFIPHPEYALIPALVLGLIWCVRRKTLVLVSAAGWGFYALYEYLMLTRVLCTGECNIRIDLFVVYTALAVLTIAAVLKALAGS